MVKVALLAYGDDFKELAIARAAIAKATEG